MKRLGMLALACAAAPGWLAAEVLDSSASGFTVKETIEIQAPRQDVYARIFRVGDWWEAAHTYSHDPRNLSIEEKAGGCYCEKLPDGGGVKHMEVVHLEPSKVILLHGAIGPLAYMAATGSMTIQLSASSGGTKVEVTYAVSGYRATGLASLASVIDGVLNTQFTRLKNVIEKGDPAAK